MNLQEVMNRLEGYGSEQTRKTYARHGASENLYGVSFANLKLLKKEIKKDQELAERLWATGVEDARTLATMIADPKLTPPTLVDEWVRSTRYYPVTDALVGYLVSKTSYAEEKVRQWRDSEDEWIGRAGWRLLSHLAMESKTLPDEFFLEFLSEIRDSIHDRLNRTREAMNGALIAIGVRNDDLHRAATEVAEAVGKVYVDHGDTNCKTPDAIPYMQKTRDRKQSKEQAK
jgi:3-methyladenine DNA glycosylase AlkD